MKQEAAHKEIAKINPGRCKDVGEILRPFLMRINMIDVIM